MDISVLTAAALALLVPYAKKAAEAFAAESGKTVFNKTKELVAWVREKLSSDPVAKDTFGRFEQEPDKYEPFLRDILSEKLAADPLFATALKKMLGEIKAAGPDVVVVQKMKEVEEVTAARIGKMKSGHLETHQEIEKGKKITGAEINELG